MTYTIGEHAQMRYFTFKPSEKRGTYDVIYLDVGKRRVEVTVSPTGRSVMVHVDGERVT